MVVLGVVVAATSPRLGVQLCGSPADEAFARADAVFVGDWIETLPGGVVPPPASDDPQRLIFEVSDVYKGEVYARQSVVTAVDGASCGLELQGDGPFLVFGRTTTSRFEPGIEDGELAADLCDGSRTIADSVGPGLVRCAGRAERGILPDRGERRRRRHRGDGRRGRTGGCRRPRRAGVARSPIRAPAGSAG